MQHRTISQHQREIGLSTSSFMIMLRAWSRNGGAIRRAHFGFSLNVTPSPTRLFVPSRPMKYTLRESILGRQSQRAYHEKSTTLTLRHID